MSLKDRLATSLKSRKGNALLLAVAAAIASTFSVYFFVSISTLSDDSKQRVTHLYNAYTMGLSVKGKINGDSMQANKLDGTKTEDDIEDSLDPLFHNGSFITLKQMITASIIIAQMDPTTTSERGEKIPYDLANSGVLIKFANQTDDVITPSDVNRPISERASLAKVHDLHLFVNLAGTTDIIESRANGPYATGTPFFYVVMATDDDTGRSDNLVSSMITVNLTQFPTGILATNQGGPQAETSVLLPQDFD
ncbi:MAG: hypothetical protein VW397_04250 [Candidatus Margulisiibacteriota bacterium]